MTQRRKGQLTLRRPPTFSRRRRLTYTPAVHGCSSWITWRSSEGGEPDGHGLPTQLGKRGPLVRTAVASAVAARAAPAAVEVETEAGVTIITLVGEHDLSDSHLLCAALRSAGDAARVLVDLTRCTYVDLAVIGRMITADRRRCARRAVGSSSSSRRDRTPCARSRVARASQRA